MSCTHRTEATYWGKVYNDWTGEYDDELITKTTNHQVDIGVGAFQCTLCKEVGYYTGSWKKFYTEGVDEFTAAVKKTHGDTDHG
jgi:hypothetical protein